MENLTRSLRLVSARLAVVFVLGYALLLLCFPIKIDTLESYAYALATEGSYAIQTTFAEVNPQGILPDFSRYHPNHPLVHWVAGELYDIWGIRALSTARTFNFVGALIALFFLLQIAALFTRRNGLALLASFMAATTTVFWMLALSGEIHMPAFALNTLALYLLCRYFLQRPRKASLLLFAAVFFTLAGAFHSIAYFSGPVAFIALLIDQYQLKNRKLSWRYFLAAASIVVSGFIFFYVYLVIRNLKITSFQQYVDLMTMYSYLGYGKLTPLEWANTFIRTYAQTLLGGFTTPLFVAKLVAIGVSCFGYFVLARSRFQTAVKFLFIAPVFFQLFMSILLDIRPNAINGWIITIPAFTVGVLFALRYFSQKQRWPVVAVVLTLIPAAINFKTAVLPNTSLNEAEYFYLRSQAPIILKETPQPRILAVAIDPVVSLPDYYDLTGFVGGKSLHILWACCGRTSYRDTLKNALERHEVDWIISDSLEGEMQTLLQETHAKTALIFDKRGEIKTDFFMSSLYFAPKENYQVYKRMQVFRVWWGAGSRPCESTLRSGCKG